MQFFEILLEKWKAFCSNARPVISRIRKVLHLIGDKLIVFAQYVSKMKKVFMAIPVAVAAVWLALYNESHLPSVVGLGLQVTENYGGEFSFEVVRELAVLGPVAVTAVCLLLMFCSRRTLTPWFVSIVSLAVPLVILLTNTVLR
ncbi:MAG: hypothetical protein ACI4PO_02635 [Faecousia sp.]